jgi:DUF4097 and DUF4098 domain-containing protein YvlB
MKVKTVILGLFSLILIGTLVLCGLTAFGTLTWLNTNTSGLRIFYNEDTSYQKIETLTYPAGGSTSLAISDDRGDISVSTHDSDQIVVEVIKTAWGEDDASAEAAANEIVVNEEKTSTGIALTYAGESKPEVIIAGSVRSDSVDFNVKVPAGTPVYLTAGGSLTLDGTTAGAELTSYFGDVKVTNVSGKLTINGSQGSLDLQHIDSGDQNVWVDQSFGTITASDIQGGDLHISTSSGDITLDDLTFTGTLNIQDSFGSITVRGMKGRSLVVDSSQGDIRIEDGELTGTLEVSNSSGNIGIYQVDAKGYTAETSSGSINLDGAKGALNLIDGFGEISVLNAEAAVLDISSSNGKISFSGSLEPHASHSIETSFGDIVLSIPEDTRLDISLETDFGEIQSEIPVTLSGTMSEDSWQGVLNGGGSMLQAVTSNGSIYVVKLAETDAP